MYKEKIFSVFSCQWHNLTKEGVGILGKVT